MADPIWRIQYGEMDLLNFYELGQNWYLGVLDIRDHDFFVVFLQINLADATWQTKYIKFS